jgi:hypothetical protein
MYVRNMYMAADRHSDSALVALLGLQVGQIERAAVLLVQGAVEDAGQHVVAIGIVDELEKDFFL